MKDEKCISSFLFQIRSKKEGSNRMALKLDVAHNNNPRKNPAKIDILT